MTTALYTKRTDSPALAFSNSVGKLATLNDTLVVRGTQVQIYEQVWTLESAAPVGVGFRYTLNNPLDGKTVVMSAKELKAADARLVNNKPMAFKDTLEWAEHAKRYNVVVTRARDSHVAVNKTNGVCVGESTAHYHIFLDNFAEALPMDDTDTPVDLASARAVVASALDLGLGSRSAKTHVATASPLPTPQHVQLMAKRIKSEGVVVIPASEAPSNAKAAGLKDRGDITAIYLRTCVNLDLLVLALEHVQMPQVRELLAGYQAKGLSFGLIKMNFTNRLRKLVNSGQIALLASNVVDHEVSKQV